MRSYTASSQAIIGPRSQNACDLRGVFLRAGKRILIFGVVVRLSSHDVVRKIGMIKLKRILYHCGNHRRPLVSKTVCEQCTHVHVHATAGQGNWSANTGWPTFFKYHW